MLRLYYITSCDSTSFPQGDGDWYKLLGIGSENTVSVGEQTSLNVYE